MSEIGEIVLEAKSISKGFPGVQALDKVDITLRSGCLTALLGENGAGKSTLMNIIAGVFPADSGEVRLGGKIVTFSNPREAHKAGIAMIFQELNLATNLTVAENIFLGREPLNSLGFIDIGKMNRDAAAILKRLDLQVEPTALLGHLRVGQQQIVEIAKSISTNARVLIMDEPTSAITEHEIDVLFELIKKLKQEGVAIAYITHKLEELTRIGDDAVVMRDGKLMKTAPLQDLDRSEIVSLMVGREIEANVERKQTQKSGEALRVEGLFLEYANRPGEYRLEDINFDVKRGEVLGIFGLMGAGRTELLESIFGLHPKHTTGKIHVNNKRVNINSPAKAITLGLALAPEDRKREGLVLGMSVRENTSLACLSRFQKLGFIDETKERKMVEKSIVRFKVKTPSAEQIIRNLSGGNQQKVILGKWLATNPQILLLDEPTRGIDVNAKAEIYSIIHELAEAGLSVVVVSSELPEIFSLVDRVIVLCEGSKTADFECNNTNEEAIMKAALPQGAS